MELKARPNATEYGSFGWGISVTVGTRGMRRSRCDGAGCARRKSSTSDLLFRAFILSPTELLGVTAWAVGISAVVSGTTSRRHKEVRQVGLCASKNCQRWPGGKLGRNPGVKGVRTVMGIQGKGRNEEGEPSVLL